MPKEIHIGSQVTGFEAPDIIYLKLVGDVSDEEGQELNRVQREIGKDLSHVFLLIDLEKLEKLPPGVRKSSTETLRELPTRGIAIYRAPFRAKVIAKMIITALNLFRTEHDKHAVLFAGSEEEARTWIAAQRAKLAAAA